MLKDTVNRPCGRCSAVGGSLPVAKGGNETEDFFLNSDSEPLRRIHGWARARLVPPWAVLFGVLVRVACSVPPGVQLPPVVGDNASLNLLCAFVGKSGNTKGASVRVAAKAWPNNVDVLPLGSGQGIAETFTNRSGKGDRIRPAIFDVPEIDTLTAHSSVQGSVVLSTLKSFAMGEQLGQANASKDSRRIVAAHSYRGCLMLGVQPGKASVLFNDTDGGTPQRFLWAPTSDPDMPDGEFPEPEPLSTAMPHWGFHTDGVAQVVYSAPEIRPLIVENHLARQRGEGDALDGHSVLTRCKVAALLAIMHGHIEVTEWDWAQSAVVMAVSDATRAGLIRHAEEARFERARLKVVDRETYDEARMQSVMRAIVGRLEKNAREMARSDLRTSLTNSHRRDMDSAIQRLAEDGVIEIIEVQRGIRYRLKSSRQGGEHRQGSSAQVDGGGDHRQGGGEEAVVIVESRSSQKTGHKGKSCREWLQEHLIGLYKAGEETVNAFAVRGVGQAAGYTLNNINVNASLLGLKGETWALSGLEFIEREVTLAG